MLHMQGLRFLLHLLQLLLQGLNGGLGLRRHIVWIDGRRIEDIGDLLADRPERGAHPDRQGHHFRRGSAGLGKVGDIFGERVHEIVLLFAFRLIARASRDGHIKLAFAGVEMAGIEPLHFVSAIFAERMRGVSHQLHRGTFAIGLRHRHFALGIENRGDQLIDLPAHVVQEAVFVAVHKMKTPERLHVVDFFESDARFLISALSRIG